MEKADFIKRLVALRVSKGASARDMSLSLGQSAGYINNIENNLDSIVNSTWKPPGYPEKKTWYANGSTPTVDDLNRIEGILLSLYSAFQRQKAVRPKLSFELKGSEF